MHSAWFESIVAWISAHPQMAGGLIFLIAFCDALAVVGIVVPALPLLFAVGTLIGLGHLSGPYAVVCAAAGAFAQRYAGFTPHGHTLALVDEFERQLNAA